MYELFVKVALLQNEHLPLYKKEYNGTLPLVTNLKLPYFVTIYVFDQADYTPPHLEWFQILRGSEEAGQTKKIKKISKNKKAKRGHWGDVDKNNQYEVAKIKRKLKTDPSCRSFFRLNCIKLRSQKGFNSSC